MKESSTKRIEVTVRVAKGVDERFDDVLRSLAGAGLRDVEAHPRFHLVSGSIATGDVEALRAVDGVESVRADQEYRAQ